MYDRPATSSTTSVGRFGIYRLANHARVFAAFVLIHRLLNLAVGRWGNSLKVVARR